MTNPSEFCCCVLLTPSPAADRYTGPLGSPCMNAGGVAQQWGIESVQETVLRLILRVTQKHQNTYRGERLKEPSSSWSENCCRSASWCWYIPSRTSDPSWFQLGGHLVLVTWHEQDEDDRHVLKIHRVVFSLMRSIPCCTTLIPIPIYRRLNMFILSIYFNNLKDIFKNIYFSLIIVTFPWPEQIRVSDLRLSVWSENKACAGVYSFSSQDPVVCRCRKSERFTEIWFFF